MQPTPAKSPAPTVRMSPLDDDDMHDESSRFDFDHWPVTQDQLRELADIALTGSARFSNCVTINQLRELSDQQG